VQRRQPDRLIHEGRCAFGVAARIESIYRAI